jgi:hypothetical protein
MRLSLAVRIPVGSLTRCSSRESRENSVTESMYSVLKEVPSGLCTMSKASSPILYVAAAFSLIAWMTFDPCLSEAETVRFSAYELENQHASWTPQDVVIRYNNAEEGILFVLDNPTDRTHAFEAPGVLELIVAENLDRMTRPLRVTVAPRETMEVRIRFTQVEGDQEALCEEGGVTCYRFYCPLHRGDNDPGGTIRVIH